MNKYVKKIIVLIISICLVATGMPDSCTAESLLAPPAAADGFITIPSVWHHAVVMRRINPELAENGLKAVRDCFDQEYADGIEQEIPEGYPYFKHEMTDDNSACFGQALKRLNEVVNYEFDAESFEEEVKNWNLILLKGSKISSGLQMYSPKKAEQFTEQITYIFSEEADKLVHNDPLRFAAKVFIDMVKLQAFNYGNHRTAALVLNYILLKLGYTPFIIVRENIKDYLRSAYPLREMMEIEQFKAFLKQHVFPVHMIDDGSEAQADDASFLVGRKARGISVFHFKGIPSNIFYDNGRLNMNLFEELIREAAFRAGEMFKNVNPAQYRMDIPVEGCIVGSERYLRRQERDHKITDNDIDIILRPMTDESLSEDVRDLLMILFVKELDKLVNNLYRDFHVRPAIISNMANPDWPSLTMKIAGGEEKIIGKLEIFASLSRDEDVRARAGGIKELLDGTQIEKHLKAYLAGEYYFGDEIIWREMRNRFLASNTVEEMQSLLDDERRAAREQILREQLNNPSDEMFEHINARLKEPIYHFNPEYDIKELLGDNLLKKALGLISECNIRGKEALAAKLTQIIEDGQVHFADHLPGTSRAQRMPDMSFRILIDRDLNWLFNRYNESSIIENDNEKSVIALLAAKLLHATAEIIMESDNKINWDLGELDPEITNTESAAYLTELDFLAQVPDFLENFEQLVQGNPPLLALYREVLGKKDSNEFISVTEFLEKLGFDIDNYSPREVFRLEEYIAGYTDDETQTSEFELPGHYRDRLYVLDMRSEKPQMTSLRFAAAKELSYAERLRAVESLKKWEKRCGGIKYRMNMGTFIQGLIGEPRDIYLNNVYFALSQDGDVEGYVILNNMVEIHPDNRNYTRYKGVGSELYAAVVQKKLELFKSQKSKEPGMDEYVYLFEVARYLSQKIDRMREGLGECLPAREAAPSTLQAYNFKFSLSDAVKFIELQRNRVMKLIAQHGLKPAGRDGNRGLISAGRRRVSGSREALESL
ncbi:MAG: hypothetical protein ABII23_03455 [bacterium]